MAKRAKVEDVAALSVELVTSTAALTRLVEMLEDTQHRNALACARNALQAVRACEEDLRKGGPVTHEESV